ncbi:DNA-binding protein RHL1 [Zea mays]|uniref:DNA-binding protein RHL1 n=2 Tax=Zea mays TaxID=4577 RepID=A0A1D6LLV7_MAIZE|nr:DNA-binding protein RHL1 [Zea mays]
MHTSVICPLPVPRMAVFSASKAVSDESAFRVAGRVFVFVSSRLVPNTRTRHADTRIVPPNFCSEISSSRLISLFQSITSSNLYPKPYTGGRGMVKKAVSTAPADAEADERRRLRSLAFSNGLLQRGDPAAPRAPLAPAAAVTRLQGRDVVRRGGQRKSRYLFSFPGLLAPAASGGRVGELADLGTKNPLLYLEFPQGRMKLFGTHVYPKNKYLTLQMTRSAKGVVCEDVFESLDGTTADCDFRGGAGGAIDEATGSKAGKEIAEPRSPKFASDDDAPEDSNHKDENNTQTMSGTPVRQSARNAGKTLKRYTDLSSGGESSDNNNETDISEDLDDKVLLLRSSEQVQWQNSQQGSRRAGGTDQCVFRMQLAELGERKNQRWEKMKSKSSQVPPRITTQMMIVTRTGPNNAMVQTTDRLGRWGSICIIDVRLKRRMDWGMAQKLPVFMDWFGWSCLTTDLEYGIS